MIRACRTLIVLLVVGAAAMTLASSASAHRGRVFGRSFGAPGSGVGQLSLVTNEDGGVTTGGSGLAVDEASHDVFIADTGNQRVDEFESSGAFVRAWGWGVRDGASEFQVCTEGTGCRTGLSGGGAGQFDNPIFVAVDNTPAGESDVYVSNYDGEGGSPGGEARVQKFTAEGVLVETWGTQGGIGSGSVPSSEHLFNIGGIAVTPSGSLLVTSNGGTFEFSQNTGAYIARIGGNGSQASATFADGLAIDGAGNFFEAVPARGVEKEGQLIEKFNSEGFSHGTYGGGPENPGFQMVFELQSEETGRITRGLAAAKSGELFVDEGDAIQVVAPTCAELCTPTSTFTSAELTDGSGLAVDSQHEVLYIAEVAHDKIESIVPEPPATPLVESGSESALNVSADSATLEAVVNPRSEASEEPTSYRFQYTSEERFEREGFANASTAPVPDGELAPNFESEQVTAHLQGLEPGTVYRYRVVSENAISRREGKASEGERGQAGEEIARTFTTQSLSGGSLLDGRVWELVSPPNKDGALLGFGAGSVLQAAAGGEAITYMATAPTEPGAPGNSNYTQVLATRGGSGAQSWISRDISTPREVANGLVLGGSEEYRFFSSDLSRGIVNPFGRFDPSLSPEASEQTAFLRTDYPAGDPGDLCTGSCYRPLVTGMLGFANVPEGVVFGREAFGPCAAGLYCGPQFEGATPDASHMILRSSIGALTEGAPERGGLYEWSDGQLELASVLPNKAPSSAGALGYGVDSTLGQGVARNAISSDGTRIAWSVSSGDTVSLYVRDMVGEETVQLGNPGAAVVYQTASSDGSRVFYTMAGELYEYEAAMGAPLSTGHVTDLVPSGGVLGFIPGASSDGSSVYFVANAVIAGAGPDGRGEVPLANQPNLYVIRDGGVKLIAVLSGNDEADWMLDSKLSPNLELMTSGVASSGRWFSFMSERPLTGYDNRDAASGERDEEVFLYDADANGGQGDLVCASCDPTRARPHGTLENPGTGEALLSDRHRIWGNRWIAANIPGWVSASYQPRYLSDSGRLFFNSSDALVPSDTNGTEDVYEYEPAGVGSCMTSSVTYSPDSGGCIDLVSSGTSKEESAFIDASENGDDVFFFTSANLAAKDLDAVPDVYDARVDGGFPVPQPPPACEGDACQSPGVAPNDPTPGSLTYSGPGNPVPLLTPAKKTKQKPKPKQTKCAKHRKRSHGKCVLNRKVSRLRRATGAVRQRDMVVTRRLDAGRGGFSG